MNTLTRKPVTDSDPAVTLTVGDWKEIVRSVLVEQNNARPMAEALAEPKTQHHFSVREAAEYLRVGVSTIRLYIKKGRLKAQRLGRRIILTRAELDKCLAVN